MKTSKTKARASGAAECQLKRGRPSTYNPAYAGLAERMCRHLGATDADLAKVMGTSVETINLWKRTHPEFAEALKNGKDIADLQVMESLYRNAIGYSYKAQKVVLDKETGIPRVVEYKEYLPGQTVAQIFWLKNRQRHLWRDKVDHEHAGTDGKPIQIVISSDDGKL